MHLLLMSLNSFLILHNKYTNVIECLFSANIHLNFYNIEQFLYINEHFEGK